MYNRTREEKRYTQKSYTFGSIGKCADASDVENV